MKEPVIGHVLLSTDAVEVAEAGALSHRSNTACEGDRFNIKIQDKRRYKTWIAIFQIISQFPIS